MKATNKGPNVGAFVSHSSGDLGHLIRELKTYGMGFARPPQMTLSPEQWQKMVEQSIQRVEQTQELLDVCALFLMRPELLALAEAEVKIPNPRVGRENLVRFYQAHATRR